jgi:hypothetical protein
LHDHILWFKDGVEHQYYINLKHNQYKGIWGLLWNIFRTYVIGTLSVAISYMMIRKYAYDAGNYYNAYLIGTKGSPIYDNNVNVLNRFETLRNLKIQNEGKDVLGRSNCFLILLGGAEHYHINGIFKPHLFKLINVEKKAEIIVKKYL